MKLAFIVLMLALLGGCRLPLNYDVERIDRQKQAPRQDKCSDRRAWLEAGNV